MGHLRAGGQQRHAAHGGVWAVHRLARHGAAREPGPHHRVLAPGGHEGDAPRVQPAVDARLLQLAEPEEEQGAGAVPAGGQHDAAHHARHPEGVRAAGRAARRDAARRARRARLLPRLLHGAAAAGGVPRAAVQERVRPVQGPQRAEQRVGGGAHAAAAVHQGERLRVRRGGHAEGVAGAAHGPREGRQARAGQPQHHLPLLPRPRRPQGGQRRPQL
mmetsp:Transcript_5320/g.10844  ORF Transcript_5320/g.10844 Transcript_5320/m.10844 type:complete len:217 (+) Transcript_5320:375-1025(+)